MQVDETGAPWPYDALEPPTRQPPNEPTWECPEGICVCHAGRRRRDGVDDGQHLRRRGLASGSDLDGKLQCRHYGAGLALFTADNLSSDWRTIDAKLNDGAVRPGTVGQPRQAPSDRPIIPISL